MPVHHGDFFTELERIKKDLKQLPLLAGAEAERFFIINFRLQGFQGDSGLEPWPKRKHDLDPSRNVLRQTGKLRQGVKKNVTATSVSVGVVGPADKYADIHNLGGVIQVTVTAKMKRWAWAMWYQTLDSRYKFMALKKEGSIMKITIPQTKFIGNSKQLDAKLEKIFETTVKNTAPEKSV